MRFAAVLILAVVGVLAACGGTSTAVTAPPAPSAGPASTIPSLTDATQAWCVQHLGGPGEDQHQVEDAALSLGIIDGAKTRDDVFERWGGMAPPDLRVSVRTYVVACQAAWEKSSAPPA